MKDRQRNLRDDVDAIQEVGARTVTQMSVEDARALQA